MKDLEQIKPQEISFEINSDEDQSRLTLILKKCIESRKKIADKLDPEIANAYKTHKGLTALKKETSAPWDSVIEKINESLKSWQIKKEYEAKLLQDKINAQLAEQAEKEKERLLKESENSDEWTKEILAEKVAEITPQTVDLKSCTQAVVVKQEGQYKRSNWKARIINAELVPKGYWIIDEKALDLVAKKEKGQIKIDGVEFYDDFTIVTKL